MEVWSLNHWTKEVLKIVILRYIFFLSKKDTMYKVKREANREVDEEKMFATCITN